MSGVRRIFAKGALLFCAAISWAESGPAVLWEPAGVREAALGGAGVADRSGSWGQSALNPAGLAYVGRRQVEISQGTIFDRVKVGELGGALPTSRGVWAGRLRREAINDIDAFDVHDQADGRLNVSDWALSAAWGRSLTERVSAGIGVDRVRQDLGAAAASTLGWNLGFTYAPARTPRLSVGAALRHVGARARFDGSSEQDPSEAAVGVGYLGLGERLVCLGDVVWSASEGTLHPRIGAEWWVKDIVSLRAGYDGGRDAGRGLGIGLGIKASSLWTLSYSYVPTGDLGQAHRFGLMFHWGGGAAEVLFQEGLRLLRQGRAAEAVLIFDKVLTLDSSHPSAARALKEAGEILSRSP
jgi:hypothetical protein